MPCGSATQGAVWPCRVQLANEDKGTEDDACRSHQPPIRLINVDPFANAFNDGPIPPDGHLGNRPYRQNDEV